jgi:acetyltransferase-like isoleucine patch superfamily enzyme
MISKIIYLLIKLTLGGVNRSLLYFYKKLFKRCGKNVYFRPLSCDFSYNTITIGNDVYIGPNALFSSLKSITIGNKVTFGPNVTIMAGDHNIKQVGTYIYDNHSKNNDDDLPVTICDDVWIGCNVTILKGVKIGKGA